MTLMSSALSKWSFAMRFVSSKRKLQLDLVCCVEGPITTAVTDSQRRPTSLKKKKREKPFKKSQRRMGKH